MAKITKIKSAPSINKHFNRGENFREYRHDCTTYHQVTYPLRKKEGSRGPIYISLVTEFVNECLGELKLERHKEEVLAWYQEVLAEHKQIMAA